MEWWSRHSILKKGDTHIDIVRMCIVWRSDLKRYPDSTGTLKSYRWILSGVDSWRRFIWLCL